MKKEIYFKLFSYCAYVEYILYMNNEFATKKCTYSDNYKNATITEYKLYIKEFANKTMEKAFEEFYKQREEIMIASSLREKDYIREGMQENYIMLGFSGDYLQSVCEKYKDRPTKWLLDEEMKLNTKFDVLRFASDFERKYDAISEKGKSSERFVTNREFER